MLPLSTGFRICHSFCPFCSSPFRFQCKQGMADDISSITSISSVHVLFLFLHSGAVTTIFCQGPYFAKMAVSLEMKLEYLGELPNLLIKFGTSVTRLHFLSTVTQQLVQNRTSQFFMLVCALYNTRELHWKKARV